MNLILRLPLFYVTLLLPRITRKSGSSQTLNKDTSQLSQITYVWMSPFTCICTEYWLDCTSCAIKIDGSYSTDSKKSWTRVQEPTILAQKCSVEKESSSALWGLCCFGHLNHLDIFTTGHRAHWIRRWWSNSCGALPATKYSTSELAPKGL